MTNSIARAAHPRARSVARYNRAVRTIGAALYHAAFLLAIGFVLAGCRSSQPVTGMTVAGDADMNNGGNAAVVRVYQLSGDSNFSRASLETFWRDDEQALGGDLIGAKQEILVYPEQEREIDLSLNPDTRFLAIAADLRNPDPVHWRQILDAEEVRGKSVIVRVGTDRLTVTY